MFTLPQVSDTSSVTRAMSPTLKSPVIIAFGCLRIHLVCNSVRDSSRCSRCSSGAPGGQYKEPKYSFCDCGSWMELHTHSLSLDKSFSSVA